jgi:hypothetical protein
MIVVGVEVGAGVAVVRANSHSSPSIQTPCTMVSRMPLEL